VRVLFPGPLSVLDWKSIAPFEEIAPSGRGSVTTQRSLPLVAARKQSRPSIDFGMTDSTKLRLGRYRGSSMRIISTTSEPVMRQAPGREFVGGIGGGMPPSVVGAIVEVDEIDGRNA